METKLFGIGTKRFGFLLIILASIIFVAAMLYSNFKVNQMVTVNTYVVVYRAMDIALIWGTIAGSGLALVGIGKYGENQKEKINKDSVGS